MDNLEDIIVPIIFGIVFLLQAIFGRKKPNDEEDDAPTTSGDPSDQFRKIREEIQRRVEENRRKNEGGGSPSQSQPSGSSPQRVPTMRPATAVSKPAQHAAPLQPAAHGMSGAERMRQMQIQIEEARKRAKQEEARAAAIRRDHSGGPRHDPPPDPRGLIKLRGSRGDRRQVPGQKVLKVHGQQRSVQIKEYRFYALFHRGAVSFRISSPHYTRTRSGLKEKTVHANNYKTK